MATYRYAAILHKDPTSDFGVHVPDVPGCFSAGETEEEAISMATEALQEHLEWMLEDGDPLPPARTEDEVQHIAEGTGFVGIVWLRVELPNTTTENHTRPNAPTTQPIS